MKSLVIVLLPCLALGMPQQWRGSSGGSSQEQTSDEKSELIESTIIETNDVRIIVIASIDISNRNG